MCGCSKVPTQKRNPRKSNCLVRLRLYPWFREPEDGQLGRSLSIFTMKRRRVINNQILCRRRSILKARSIQCITMLHFNIIPNIIPIQTKLDFTQYKYKLVSKTNSLITADPLLGKVFQNCVFPLEDGRMTETCSGWEIDPLKILFRRRQSHTLIQA
jgi:hypothetical protein